MHLGNIIRTCSNIEKFHVRMPFNFMCTIKHESIMHIPIVLMYWCLKIIALVILQHFLFVWFSTLVVSMLSLYDSSMISMWVPHSSASLHVLGCFTTKPLAFSHKVIYSKIYCRLLLFIPLTPKFQPLLSINALLNLTYS